MRKVHQNRKIQKEIMYAMILLVSVATMLMAIISCWVSVHTEKKNMDLNLENMAQAIAQSQLVSEELLFDSGNNNLFHYLKSLERSINNVDVISVIDKKGIRRYHTNQSLMGTVYDGTRPDFNSCEDSIYVTDDVGPSGAQRRAYAVIYDENGDYAGFVLAVMLKKNVYRNIRNTILGHVACTFWVILLAVLLSRQLSYRIKKSLHGYEPDTFSSMFNIRENILESLEEGILAIGTQGEIIYMNEAAGKMLLCIPEEVIGQKVQQIDEELWEDSILETKQKRFGVMLRPDEKTDIIADMMPVMEDKQVVGGLCILRDRTEYTKLMEDLSGVRYMVESMRANNHDFINKLHVILGLIQMGNTKKACEYITNITSIQQNLLHHIMKNIADPSVAALLIGKYARAAELNIRFSLEPGSKLSRNDIALPSGDLVTIIGNLLDNAMDSMNEKESLPKELMIGIHSQPHALLISVDDTGMGIEDENLNRIFENGFSTKGDNRGTGMYVTQELVRKYGGNISVESEAMVGTSITVTLTEKTQKEKRKEEKKREEMKEAEPCTRY